MQERILWEGTPDRKVLIVWLFSRLLLAFLVIFAIGIMPLFWGKATATNRPTYILMMGLLAIFTFYFIYLIFLRRTFRYAITEKGVYFMGGLLVKKQKSVPFHKITNVTISQNIIEQIFNLHKIGFQTAGAGGVAVPEIRFEGIIDAQTPKNIVEQFIVASRGT